MSTINKEIGKRIADARKRKGLSAVELSKITGFSSARISHWEQGKRLPNLDSILTLQKALDAPAAYLLCIETVSSSFNAEQSKVIPIYDITMAGGLNEVKKIQIPDNTDDDLFAVELIDSSMSPTFQKKDIVVFSKNKNISEGAYILFQLKKTKQVLFRKYTIDYSNIDSPQIQLTPLNKDFNTISPNSMDPFTVLGIYREKSKLFM